jgi:hypothetical protein
MRIFVMWIAVSLLSALISCAPLTETERFDLTNRMVLAKEEYSRKEESCENNGGSMSMSARPIGQPDYFDYKTAQCIRR